MLLPFSANAIRLDGVLPVPFEGLTRDLVMEFGMRRPFIARPCSRGPPVRQLSHSSFLKTLHYFRDRDAKRLRYGFDVSQRDISFPALNPTDVSPVKIALLGKLFLGKPRASTEIAEPFPKSDRYIGSPRHRADTLVECGLFVHGL